MSRPGTCARRAVAGAALLALVPRRARAYGLGKPPPDAERRRELYETSRAARTRAEETRDARDRDADEDAPTVTLRSGLRYREYATGMEGPAATVGSRVEFRYKARGRRRTRTRGLTRARVS